MTKPYETKLQHEKRQREKGFVKTELWVPEHRKEELREVARKMREESTHPPERF